jgi:hypothetical protein
MQSDLNQLNSLLATCQSSSTNTVGHHKRCRRRDNETGNGELDQFAEYRKEEVRVEDAKILGLQEASSSVNKGN